MHGLEALLTAWGLPLVTASCFIEGDAAAMVGGALAHRGTFGFGEAVFAAALGAFLSDQFWFHVGRRIGATGMVRHHLDRPVLARLGDWLRRRPNLAIIGVRFVWGIRIAGPTAIGAAGVSPWRFLALDLPATIVWATLLTGMGYGVGATIERAVGSLHLLDHLGLVAVGVGVLSILLWLLHRRARRRAARPS
nr:DedA family protein [Rubellimicrobium arenae]